MNNAELFPRALKRAAELAQRDPEARGAIASDADLDYLRSQGPHCIDYIAAACHRYAQRPCVGSRRDNGPFAIQTYAEIWQRVQRLATAWSTADLVRPGDFVSICGFSSVDWLVSYLACLYLGAVAVPLRTNMSSDDLQLIIEETAARLVVCSAEQAPVLQGALPRCKSVQNVVVMDDPSWQAAPRHAPPAWSTLPEQERNGSALEAVPYHRVQAGTDPLVTLLYTSGSTGDPKGAMFPDSVWSHTFRGALSGLFPSTPMISVGFLPLNHMAGLGTLFQVFMQGGVTYFVQKSDMSTLFADIEAARPTSLMLVPRISEMLFARYHSECSERGGESAAAEVLHEMRNAFGDRLCYAISAGAPTAPEISEFLQRCLQVPVLDAYGATENGTIAIERQLLGIVSDFKLVDVPELGYLTSDKPYPRGELCVKSPRNIPGYYKSPELSAALRDPDGFIKTGDIMEQRGPRELVWVDRKSNVLKLSHGEFVSVAQLENLYIGGSGAIEQAYLYGNSSRSYLLAVLVPRHSVVQAQLGAAATDADIKQLLRRELDRVARSSGAQSYEVPRDFIVERHAFTKENGLLTESSKPARPKLRARYGDALEALYAELDAKSVHELRDLARWRSLGIEAQVHKAAAIALGSRSAQEDAVEQSFVQLGGDSLGAVRFCDILRELSGAAPPVGMVLDRSTSLRAIADYLQRQAKAERSAGSYDAIHGKEASVVHAHQLHLSRLLPDAAQCAKDAEPASRSAAQVVLLTGANGFLGRFLLLDLLEQLGSTQGKVVCLVRAKDDAAALQRLRDGYARGDGGLLARFDQLASGGRLEVHAGDLMREDMGLRSDVHARLCQEVDSVLHNGALVNHALSYAQLFEPNVLGTVEVMRFALQRRIKAIAFVSTVAVTAGLRRAVLERESAAELWPSRPASGGYAAGYGTSKWACEVLLGQLHEQHGVPVTIFRCGMLLGHSQALGQINPGDFFTRLLHGMIHTSLAPRSFYRRPEGQHFDGIPVDFAAQAISRISLRQRLGSHIYHVTNPHLDDGISLDTIARWVESAGYTLRWIAPYERWFNELSAALETMDPAQRALSPWPILSQWEQPGDDAPAELDARLFRRALGDFTEWTDVPRVSEELIHRVVQGMAALTLVHAPAGSRTDPSTSPLG